MAEHGFLQPNPALLSGDLLDKRKRRAQLAHELGEGAKCLKCGDGCSGFQLHYWRKVCLNCRCGKAEHNVVDDHDPGFYFVGKIFDRPLRSRQEEMEFCYGDVEEDSVGSNSGIIDGSSKKNGAAAKNKGQGKTVRFDWVPPDVSKALARRYMKALPESAVPIAGSSGAQSRKQQLERQFPLHDIEPTECHELSPPEVQSMKDYIAHVKEDVAGQAVVSEIDADDFPPPPSDEMLRQLEVDFGRKAAIGGDQQGSYYARPVNGHLGAPRPFPGSTASSSTSSRNDSPSPTSSNDDSGIHSSSTNGPYSNGLSRPSKFSSGLPGTAKSSAAGNPPSAGSGSASASPISSSDKNGGMICVGCEKPLNAGDVVVKAERAGRGKVWHPGCFKCDTCKDLLADLLYYYESGKVYCARDYAAKAKIPRCAACDELIFAAEYTGAEKKSWHLKHFCCYDCDRPLAGHKYIPVDGQPRCIECFQKKHGKKCNTCGDLINPEDQRVSLEGKHWHASDQCFACAVCFVPLIGRKMTRNKETGLVLCSSACNRKVVEKSGSAAAAAPVASEVNSNAAAAPGFVSHSTLV